MIKKIIPGLLFVLITCFIVSCSRHTEYLGSVAHREGYENPEISCTECHGYDLKGDGAAPSCYECHQKKWE